MENVRETLRQEQNNRVFVLESRGGLFKCLSQHVFNVEDVDLRNIFQTFMRRDEEKSLFTNILQILDNTGNVPVKAEEENDDAFKARLNECYETLVNTCSDIKPHSDFLHVYVFAIATLIGRPIYVLHQDEAGGLSWSYFPFLYSHTYDSVRDKPNYTAHRYITMYFSDDDCYMIDSSRSQGIEPSSYGCIGMYQKRARVILLNEEITERCVGQMARRIQRPEVQLNLQRVISTEIIKECLNSYNAVAIESYYSRNTTNTLPSLPHRPDKNDFIGHLLYDRRLLECLYKLSVEHKEGFRIWQCMESQDGFLPSEFRTKLLRLENAILELDVNALEFVTKCRTTSEELSERRSKVNKSVIGGSAVGILGGGLAIAGLILTPFTFGASLGLTIAGASLGAAGGIAGGGARVFEGVKQNISINEVKAMQGSVAEKENNFVTLIRDIEVMINTNSERHFEHNVEGPGINKRGFLAIGSAFRSLHGGAAIGLAALRVGAVGATIAASVLGPVSLVLDIGFLAEAAHDLRTGCKTGAGRILEQNARAIEMKINFFKCMLRGNSPSSRWIVD